MELVVLKYVQLVCITIFMQNNANCAQLMSQTEEMNNIKVAACTANCIDLDRSYNLTSCYTSCADRMETLDDVEPSQLNATFRLYCRDSERLLIQFEHEDENHVGNEKFIYLVVIQETRTSFMDRSIYILDKPLIELKDLKSSQSYNISGIIVSPDGTFTKLGTQIFTTLKKDYVPENVNDLWLERLETVEDHVEVVLGWNPARDQTCKYEVALHRESEEFRDEDMSDSNLYYKEYDDLKFDATYNFAVRGKNTKNNSLESSLFWFEFETPSCWKVLGINSTVCPPEDIKELNASFTHIKENFFTLDVQWNRMNHIPEFFALQLGDSISNGDDETGAGIYNFTIDAHQTSFYKEGIAINGSMCKITLSAYLNDQVSTYTVLRPTARIQPSQHSSSLPIIFYAFVVFTAIFLIVLFRVWQGRITSIVETLTQKQLDNMDLDLIKSITNRSMLEAIADLTRDSTMEIERENIALLEALGEGAFGLVRKAIFVREGKKHQVAVKMLKNSANIDDIKQFHQEISVMKSVGKHPNIVSIIGHCTSNIEELMLLTEFCDDGNLLDYLRGEFTKQLNFYDRKKVLSPAMSPQKYPDSLHNFDADEKETASYKNLGCSSRLFVVNQMYEDLNNNNNSSSHVIEMHQRQETLKAIEMTATNALYLELSDNDTAPVIVEIAEWENPKNFLTSSDLISFAKQVSDGMDFLARKKVVHRDLAARNILVCSDRRVKIADFGLSRDIYEDNIYRKLGSGKLPIKWLAMESMSHQVYTSQSDVWSFGVLLYEIVTLGATPYPAIGADQLLKILNTGYRMEKPRHCHPSLYDLMMSCWHANPTDRPVFEELSCKLNHFLKLENSWERFVDLQALFDKCTSEINYMTIA